jgi:aminoglycoside 6'-N-acetyltransferase I
VPIEIRLLGPEDEWVLANVAPDVFDDPVDARATAAFLNDRRHRLVVAIDQDCVVGFVSAVIYLHPDKPRPDLWINEVGVAATHQRQGLGQRLIEELLAAAGAVGCSEAWVLTIAPTKPQCACTALRAEKRHQVTSCSAFPCSTVLRILAREISAGETGLARGRVPFQLRERFRAGMVARQSAAGSRCRTLESNRG